VDHRINAAVKAAGLSYSKFMHGLKDAGLDLEPQGVGRLAMNDEAAFQQLVVKAKAALEAAG